MSLPDRSHYTLQVPKSSNANGAEVFQVPTAEFISYEANVRTPWFFKRYIFFQRHIETPPPIIALGGAKDEI